MPRLEALEDRTVLSTLTVLNDLDNGPGSLRDTIVKAGAGDTIVFAKSVHQITLTSGELAIGKNLDIEGPGAKRLTISGDDANRVFDITGGSTVTIAGLTVADGLADFGGGILNGPGASLTVTNCTLTDNQAVSGNARGGGLMNQGTATVTRSTFIGNQASGDVSGEFVFGGAIANSLGTLTVTDSSFTGNQAVSVFMALGGAIDSSGPATITNTTFTANRAVGGTPGGASGGGAIFLDGFFEVAPSMAPPHMTVSNSTFTRNQSLGGDGGDGVNTFGFGGGGAIINFLGTLTVLGSTLRGNQAIGAALAPDAVPSQNANQGTTSGAGGIFTLGGILTVADSTLTGNQGIGGAGSSGGAGAVGSGGGISAYASAVVTLKNSTLSHNLALGGAGGSGAPGGAGLGGGIEVAFDSTLTVTDTIITHNRAIGGPGGSGAAGGLGGGGGIVVGSGAFYGFPDSSSLTLGGSTLDHNRARGGVGGVGGNGGNGEGGGIAALAGTASVGASTITKNRALGGAGGAGANGGNGWGGGLFNDTGSTLALTDAQVTHNFAIGGFGFGGLGQGVGGGVYDLGDLGMFTFDAATRIKKNRASTHCDDIFSSALSLCN